MNSYGKSNLLFGRSGLLLGHFRRLQILMAVCLLFAGNAFGALYTGCSLRLITVGFVPGACSYNYSEIVYSHPAPSVFGYQDPGYSTDQTSPVTGWGFSNVDSTWPFYFRHSAGGTCSGAGIDRTAAQYFTANNQTLTFTLYWNSGETNSGGAPTTNCWSEGLYNSGVEPLCYTFANAATGAQLGSGTIPPQSSRVLQVCNTSATHPVQVRQFYCSVGSGANDYIYTNNNWATSNTNDGWGQAPNGVASTNLTFSGDAGDAKDSTLREGFSTLRDLLYEQANRDAAQQAAQAATLTSIDSKAGALAGIKTDTAAIATSTAGIKTDTAAIASSAATAATKLNSIDITAGDIRTAVNSLNTTVGSQSANIASIKVASETSASVLSGNLPDIKTHVNYIRTATEAANTVLANNLPDMKTHLSYIRTADEGILAGVGTINTTLTSIDGRVATLNGNLDGVEGLLQNIYTTVGDARTLAHNDSMAMTNVLGGGQAVQIADFRAYTNMFKDGSVGVDERLAEQQSAGEAAGQAQSDSIAALSSGAVAVPTGVGGAGSVFVISALGRTFNLDPLTNAKTAWLAPAVRSALIWFVTIALLFACWESLQRYLIAGQQARQASAPDVSVFGNSFGTLLGIPIAAAMTVAIAAIPAIGIALLGSLPQTAWTGNPFDGMFDGGSAGSAAMYLATAFLPIDIILADIVIYFVFTTTIASVYSLSCTICRFLLG